MPSLPQFFAFLATTAFFAFIPGPAMLYAAARTLAGGRRAGLMASLGIHLGGYAHVIASAAGLTVLLKTVPVLYVAVRFAGALYLIWLGLGLVRSQASLQPEPALGPASGGRAFGQSIAIEMLNPKTALFFLAFLPQFVDPGAGIALQLAVLGTIVNLMFSIADIVCVLLAGAVVERLRRSGRAMRLMRRTGGAVLIGLGAHIALQRA